MNGELGRYRQPFPRPTERLPQAGQHGQVSMEGDALQTTNAERGESVVVLQAPERAFNCGAAT
jgi:hypothetical protein